MFRSLLRADFLVFLKHRRALIISMVLPVFVLISTSGNKATNKFGGAEFVIGLAISYALLSTALVGYALTVARDREKGVFQRLRVTPAPTWTIMSSRITVQLVYNLITSLVVIVVAVIIHGLSLDVGQYLLVLAIAVVGAALFLSLGQALVGLVRSTTAVNAVGRLLFIVLWLLGLLGPSGILGDTVKTITEWTPVGALMRLFADTINDTAWVDQDWYSLLACFGYIVVFAFIGIRWFRWESR